MNKRSPPSSEPRIAAKARASKEEEVELTCLVAMSAVGEGYSLGRTVGRDFAAYWVPEKGILWDMFRTIV